MPIYSTEDFKIICIGGKSEHGRYVHRQNRRISAQRRQFLRDVQKGTSGINTEFRRLRHERSSRIFSGLTEHESTLVPREPVHDHGVGCISPSSNQVFVMEVPSEYPPIVPLSWVCLERRRSINNRTTMGARIEYLPGYEARRLSHPKA
jgi:hypothetical protein